MGFFGVLWPNRFDGIVCWKCMQCMGMKCFNKFVSRTVFSFVSICTILLIDLMFLIYFVFFLYIQIKYIYKFSLESISRELKLNIFKNCYDLIIGYSKSHCACYAHVTKY